MTHLSLSLAVALSWLAMVAAVVSLAVLALSLARAAANGERLAATLPGAPATDGAAPAQAGPPQSPCQKCRIRAIRTRSLLELHRAAVQDFHREHPNFGYLRLHALATGREVALR